MANHRLCIPPEDADLIDFCLAVYKSHEIPGDPLWGIFIDASGAGKTELLRAFRSRPNTYFLSNLTEKTLVSGYRDPKKPNEDPSLLPALDEKVLIIKDLSPLLAMRRESRTPSSVNCGMPMMDSRIKAGATWARWSTRQGSLCWQPPHSPSNALAAWTKS